MKSAAFTMASACLVLGVCAEALATTYRIDDSATIPLESNAVLRWRQFAPARKLDNTMEGSTIVQVRLNLAPWLKRNGRVFLVLPEQPPGRLNVSWTTQGRMLPGQLVSGQRVLVYAGPISTPQLDETLQLRIAADGTQLAAAYRIAFHFEIDVD